ncbi:MAG: hypothetical protein FWE50_03185 [Alphaproteobacteria bacterium]|nr:hypothetical protein [Alphaproteobacteria bacterium]
MAPENEHKNTYNRGKAVIRLRRESQVPNAELDELKSILPRNISRNLEPVKSPGFSKSFGQSKESHKKRNDDRRNSRKFGELNYYTDRSKKR